MANSRISDHQTNPEQHSPATAAAASTNISAISACANGTLTTNHKQIKPLKEAVFSSLAKRGLFQATLTLPENVSADYQRKVSHTLEFIIIEMYQPLLQAVVDDDLKKVTALLDRNPALLLVDPPNDLVIESKKTWQKFYAKKPLMMATARKQLEMTKLLFSYYDKLETTDTLQEEKMAALSAWPTYKTQIEDDRIFIIPQEYIDYLQWLVNLFIAETFPYGTNTYVRLSEETEAGLSCLFNLLSPKSAIQLDERYVDVELLLLTAYKMYDDHFTFFDNHENLHKANAFCIRVIGLIQGALTPDTAKFLCEGLNVYFSKNDIINARAASLQLCHGKPFYRPSRDSHTGSGFEYFCGCNGQACRRTGGWHDDSSPILTDQILYKMLLRYKNKQFNDYKETAIQAITKPKCHHASLTPSP